MNQSASTIDSFVQLTLPIISDRINQEGAKNGRGAFNDPAFADNKDKPIHRWVPWIAGYSYEFVQDVIERYLDRPGTILDPFTGVGTTLVESLLAGHQSIGFEINPYAALASHVKTSLAIIDQTELSSQINKFSDFYVHALNTDYKPQTTPPTGFRTRSPFYSPKVLHKVLILHDFIEMIDDLPIRDLFRLTFASTMVRYSNYSYEPSLGRRVSAGKEEILDFPVGELIREKLLQMLDDIDWYKQHKHGSKCEAKIINDTFFAYAHHIAPDSVDLVITSPPYLNNYHYNRNTRPHLYWLGYANKPKDLKPLELSNFGKYWQTVREKKGVELEIRLPGSDLADKLAELRQKKVERGIYGGNGWANYAASYFNDCYKLAEGLAYVLKPGGHALVVLGNSILQGIMFPTDKYFGQISQEAGLEVVQIDIPRATRVGNSIIQSSVRTEKAKKKHSLYEAIVELRKR
jgi:DNA modification methylase